MWILIPTLCGPCVGRKDSTSTSRVNLMTRHEPISEFHALATGNGSGMGTANQANPKSWSLTICKRSSLFLLDLNRKGCEAVPITAILPPENKVNSCGKKPGDKDTRILCLLSLGAGVWESAPSPDHCLT